MDALKYIAKKYKVALDVKMPVVLDKMGREEFADMLNDLGLTKGAEIGVQRGDFSEVLCKRIPGLKFYGVDSWTAYEGYIDFRKGHDSLEAEQTEVWDKYYIRAKERLAPFDATLIQGWSQEVVTQFEDNSLDWVYIDANHDLRHTIDDIDDWSKKVRPGGIISGHDYWRSSRDSKRITIHVKDAVNAWTYLYKINPWFIFTRDRCPNWFWVKS